MDRVSHPTDRDQFCCGRTDIACRLLERGFVPVPLLPREKQPAIPEWQKLTRQDVEARLHELFGKSCNIGVLLGTPSGGLIDIDLDCDEAIRAAPLLLPPDGHGLGPAFAGGADSLRLPGGHSAAEVFHFLQRPRGSSPARSPLHRRADLAVGRVSRGGRGRWHSPGRTSPPGLEGAGRGGAAAGRGGAIGLSLAGGVPTRAGVGRIRRIAAGRLGGGGHGAVFALWKAY
jgi:hypothetical protein